jgi:hypothetical protein
MPTTADEMSDLAARLSRLSPEQLDEVKRRSTPAPAKFAARQEPDAFKAMIERAIREGIAEGLGQSADVFKASADHGPSHADVDDVETLPALDDPVSRRLLRPYGCTDVEVAVAAATALREFNALRDSPACALTSMGPERYIAAHPLVLEAQGIAEFKGR